MPQDSSMACACLNLPHERSHECSCASVYKNVCVSVYKNICASVYKNIHERLRQRFCVCSREWLKLVCAVLECCRIWHSIFVVAPCFVRVPPLIILLLIWMLVKCLSYCATEILCHSRSIYHGSTGMHAHTA